MVNVGQPKAQGSCLAPKTDFWRHRDSEGKYPPTLKDRQLGAGPKFKQLSFLVGSPVNEKKKNIARTLLRPIAVVV